MMDSIESWVGKYDTAWTAALLYITEIDVYISHICKLHYK